MPNSMCRGVGNRTGNLRMALVTVLLLTTRLDLSVSRLALLAPSVLIGPELQRGTLSGRGNQTTLPARRRNWPSFMRDQSHPSKQNSPKVSKHPLRPHFFFSRNPFWSPCCVPRTHVLGRRPGGLWLCGSPHPQDQSAQDQAVLARGWPLRSLQLRSRVGRLRWPPRGRTHRTITTKRAFSNQGFSMSCQFLIWLMVWAFVWVSAAPLLTSVWLWAIPSSVKRSLCGIKGGEV